MDEEEYYNQQPVKCASLGDRLEIQGWAVVQLIILDPASSSRRMSFYYRRCPRRLQALPLSPAGRSPDDLLASVFPPLENNDR